MNRLLPLCAAALVACSSDSVAVDPDAIDGAEKAAVQAALNVALKADSLYPTLAFLVFPFIDRASHVSMGNGEARFVGIEIDIDAVQAGTPVAAQFATILGWRGYSSTTQTVDSAFVLMGAGITPPPVEDQLSDHFSPDAPGTGVGYVVQQASDSSVQAWLSYTGTLHVTGSAYGASTTTTYGTGLVLAASRGTLHGDFQFTGQLIPVAMPPDVSAAASLAGGIQALKLRITGTVP
jgi:hypothetical protein